MITDEDWAAVSRYMRERARLVFEGDTATHAELLVTTLATHREAAFKAGQEARDREIAALVDLLTKAVGDIVAALIMAGKHDKAEDWTAPYIGAVNAHDAIERHAHTDQGEG